ncbi:hypothetical protein M876_03660 [Elizabethkingia anophelis FMS-007]|nr:hypothetical protein M876_03660 [Elizabethkingia anophelis FMS-007]EQB93351.1 hypothetical protein C874_01110 [Elizabethkingia anophelis 502]
MCPDNVYNEDETKDTEDKQERTEKGLYNVLVKLFYHIFYIKSHIFV